MMKIHFIICLSLFFVFNVKAQEKSREIQELLGNRTQYFVTFLDDLKGMQKTLFFDKGKEKELYFNGFVFGEKSSNTKEYNFFLKVDELKKTNDSFSFDKAMASIHDFFKDKYLFSKDVNREHLIAIYRDRFWLPFIKKGEEIDIWFFEFDVNARSLSLITAGSKVEPTLLIPYLSDGTIPLAIEEINPESRIDGGKRRRKWTTPLPTY